ncbi:MAG: hypothetical protein Athens101428_723, partial [Candidatus Berkelbacteria bacterium Athens1014_28]
NIDRAIKRGTGELGGAAIEEIIYEGYGPGGVAILILCLTDNRQRAVSEIRSVFNKFGGSLAEAGSVSYLFEKKGQIIISQTENSKTVEQLGEIIINSGADDFEIESDDLIIYTQIFELQKVVGFFRDAGIKIQSSEIVYLPKSFVEVSSDKKPAVEKLLSALDDLDDVSEIFTNG